MAPRRPHRIFVGAAERSLIALSAGLVLWPLSTLAAADPLGCAAFTDGLDGIESIEENDWFALANRLAQSAWEAEGEAYHPTRCQIAAHAAGGSVMAYSDEWWKAGEPARHDTGGYPTDTHPDGFANEEWWGLVAIEDAGNEPDVVHPRQAYVALADRFAGSDSCCPADLTGDGDVGFADLVALLAAWGTADCRADPDGNGNVGFDDLILLLAAWGPCLN